MACERTVHPAGCLESGCDRLYSHIRDGRTLIGCLEGIFAVEIDLERFARLERTNVGYGGLRAVRPPLRRCRSEVQYTYPHRGVGPCVNPAFLLASGGSDMEVTATMMEES